VKKPPRKIEAYTDEEQERLRAVFAAHRRTAYPAVEIMLETGMRVGETLALDWKSVQLGAGQCALKRPSSTF
jgi:integrase